MYARSHHEVGYLTVSTSVQGRYFKPGDEHRHRYVSPLSVLNKLIRTVLASACMVNWLITNAMHMK